jgi:hypothetical protein
MNADGDIIYIKATKVTDLEGNDYTRPKQTVFTASPNEEYLSYEGDMTEFQTASQGSIVYVNDNISHSQFTPFSSGSGEWLAIGVTDSKAALQFLSPSKHIRSTSIVLVGDVIEWQSDGGTYKLLINGVEDVIEEFIGSNDGRWLSGLLSMDTLHIGRADAFYADTIHKELIVTSTPLTDAQSKSVADYLYQQHGVKAPASLNTTHLGYNLPELTCTDTTGGDFDEMQIFRSEDNINFVQIGTSLTTTYRDVDIVANDNRLYYYKTKFSIDGELSRFSNTATYTSNAIALALRIGSSSLNEMILSGTDVVALLDGSKGLSTDELVYTQDTSSGVDGWVYSAGTLVSGESIGGRNNVLKAYSDNTLTIHRPYKGSILQEGGAYSINTSIYIPSGNTNLNGFRVLIWGGDVLYEDVTPPLDTWIDLSDLIGIGISPYRFEITTLSSGSVSYAGANDPNDDIIYIDSTVITKTAEYVSDFSVDEDGWTVDDPATNSLDGGGGHTIGGRDNAYKFSPNGEIGVSHFIQNNFGEIGDLQHNKYEVFIPSSNTNVNGFLIQRGSNISDWIFEVSPILDEWIDIDHKGLVHGSEINIFSVIDGGIFFTGGNDINDDEIYIRGIEVKKIQGNHVIQPTALNRPIVDSDTDPTQTQFLASPDEEHLYNDIDVSDFTGLSEGSVFYVNDGSSIVQLSIADDATAANNFIFGQSVGGKALLQTLGGANVIESVDSVSVDSIIEIQSTGSEYKIFIDGVQSAVTTTNGNDGLWFDSIPDVDNISIGALLRSTPFYDDTTHKETIVTSGTITDAERTDIMAYLTEKNQ